MTKKILFISLILLFAFGTVLFAEGEDLTIKIAVMGPGDELYFWWGHIGLMIDDAFTGRSNFFDYGLFSFDNENFFFNFAFGRLLYSCGASSTERNLAGYILTNRDVKIYTLDLGPQDRKRVKDFAELNVLPQNRDYYYHHFKDNCSTRIRDIIDFATDGQFKEQYENAAGRFTLRQHVRRHTWFSPAADWILNFWMGQVIDKPITMWEDMFLPSEVGRNIEDFWYTDSDGNRRKLVTDTEVINTAINRPRVLDIPRKQWPRELAFSLVLAAIFGFFFFLQEKNRKAGRVLSGISISLAGLVFGFASLLLYFLNLFTNHDYTYQNTNMLFATPLLLAAFPLGICYALTKKQDKLVLYGALIRIIWLLTVIGIIISMLIKVLPQFYQQNLTDQMLMLPIALVFSFQPLRLKEELGVFIKRKKA